MNELTERALKRASIEGKCDLEGGKDPDAGRQVDGQRESRGGSRVEDYSALSYPALCEVSRALARLNEIRLAWLLEDLKAQVKDHSRKLGGFEYDIEP